MLKFVVEILFTILIAIAQLDRNIFSDTNFFFVKRWILFIKKSKFDNILMKKSNFRKYFYQKFEISEIF